MNLKYYFSTFALVMIIIVLLLTNRRFLALYTFYGECIGGSICTVFSARNTVLCVDSISYLSMFNVNMNAAAQFRIHYFNLLNERDSVKAFPLLPCLASRDAFK